MHLIHFLQIILLISIYNQIFSFARQITTSTIATTTTILTPKTSSSAVVDLQDGHPNHQLWQKAIETERASFHDCTNLQRSDASVKTVEEFLDTLINSSRYDRRVRPFFDQQKPCNVTMTIHINTISAINEVNMDYNTDIIFRQSWYDPRLNYSGTDWAAKAPQITLHYSLIDRIWVPDSFFRNAKEGKRSDITVPNRLIRISRDGKVLYSQRLLLKLDCQMKLQKFPLDNQTCVVNIGSYAFATNDLAFYWEESQNVSAIRVNEDLEMPDFVLSNYESKYCNRTTATGSFTCLLVVLHLKRLFGYYLVQIYIPSMLIVILSFVSFWIDHKSVPARISVGLLTVLTVTTQSSGIRSQLPRVSYIKAIDVWMSACLVFVFAGLLEYALVNVIARKGELKQQVRFSKERKGPDRPPKLTLIQKLQNGSTFAAERVIGNRLAQVQFYKKDDGNDSAETMEALVHKSSSADRNASGNASSHVQYSAMSNISAPASTQANPLPQVVLSQPAMITQAAKPIRDSAQFVDLVSAVLFPVAFIVFNIIYWMVYLNMQVEYVLK